MPSLPSERGFSASNLFVWLFALAISTRVFYAEIIQLSFFSMMLACAWVAPSLRASVLANLQKFFARGEGKIFLLLLLSATLTTLLASLRSDKAFSIFSGSVFLWLNWLKILVAGGALFGCTALLAQPPEVLRRFFRLAALCLLAGMVLWTSALIAEQMKPGLSALYSRYVYDYWLYSQVGVVVIFFPFICAAFGDKSRGVLFSEVFSENIVHKILWRSCVVGALLLLLSAAVITERRVMGVAVSVAMLVLVLALGLRRKQVKRLLHLWLPLLLVLGVLLFAAALLRYLYHHPVVHEVTNTLCDGCNILYLPSWLVDDARQIVWYETILVWQDHPWLGRGIDNDLAFAATHPHNRFLQILSGLGIVGFGLFVSLLLLLFAKASKRWYRTGSLSALSLMFVHSVYWTTGLFELEVWVKWHFCMYISAVVLSMSLDRLGQSKLALSKLAQDRITKA